MATEEDGGKDERYHGQIGDVDVVGLLGSEIGDEMIRMWKNMMAVEWIRPFILLGVYT